MADIMDIALGNEQLQFLTSLRLVKDEVNNTLEQAINQLDAYAEHSNADHFVAFLEEVQQLRGTFKMIGFRSGERLCEEIAETGRIVRNKDNQSAALQVFTQALFYLSRYLECAVNEEPIASSLLIATINSVRKERKESALPEAYFFTANLRPQVNAPKADESIISIPYRRARQLFQLGLLGLIRQDGRQGPIQLMSRAVNRFEQLSRGSASWLFWHVVQAAVEGLAQDDFAMTAQRLRLLRQLDLQVKQIQELEMKAFVEKAPDWLLKEFLYLAAIAEPTTQHLQNVQQTFRLREVKEKELAKTRALLQGPDQSAMVSLSKALHEEIQSVKDLIDLFERTGVDNDNLVDLQTSLTRIADTFTIANLTEAAEKTHQLGATIKQAGATALKDNLVNVADQVIDIEQRMLALAHGRLDTKALVDPVSLKEARVAVIHESMAALAMVKRAISSYLESNNDKMHIQNIGKTLLDVAGAFFFLEEKRAYKVANELNAFVKGRIIEASSRPTVSQVEALADVVSALEFYLDSLQHNAKGAKEALKLAIDSVQQLRA